MVDALHATTVLATILMMPSCYTTECRGHELLGCKVDTRENTCLQGAGLLQPLMVGSRPPRRALPGKASLPAHKELEGDPGIASLLFWAAVWVCRPTSSPDSRPGPLPHCPTTPAAHGTMLPPALSLSPSGSFCGVVWWGAGVGRSQPEPVLEAGSWQQMRPGHPNDAGGSALECFCASMMDHDSLSEMGRAAEPWKSLEGKRA